MPFIAGALVAVIVLLVIALYRQQIGHLNQIGLLLQKADIERSSLLDRIQFPAVRQVEAVPQAVYEPPRDAAELAMVGMEVPDFTHVGENGGNPAN